MNEQTQTVVELEPPFQRRSAARGPSDIQLKKADLSAIMSSEMVVLVSAIGQTIVNGLEMKERRRMRKRLLFIACGLAFLTGMIRLAMQLVQS